MELKDKILKSIRDHWRKMLMALVVAPFALVSYAIFHTVLMFGMIIGFAYGVDFLGVRSTPARHDTSVPNS